MTNLDFAKKVADLAISAQVSGPGRVEAEQELQKLLMSDLSQLFGLADGYLRGVEMIRRLQAVE